MRVDLPLRGIHNVRNAVGALAMAGAVGVDFEVAAGALAKFGGVARRFDIRGVDDGVALVDDYAHLPSEISAVLSAARSSGDGWRRVVAVFQPNRFNRMACVAGIPGCIRRRRSGVRPPLRLWHDAHPVSRASRRERVLDAHPRGLLGLDATTDRVPVAQLRDGDSASRCCGDMASCPTNSTTTG